MEINSISHCCAVLILSTYCNRSSYGSLRLKKVSTASENQSGHSLTGRSGCYGPVQSGSTPLHAAAASYRSNTKVIKMLKKAGADVHATDEVSYYSTIV